MYLLQELQRPLFDIKAKQYQITLVNGEENTNKIVLTDTSQFEQSFLNSTLALADVSLISSSGSKKITQFSSQAAMSDTSDKYKKRWIEQTYEQLKFRWILVKTRVSDFDRKVRLAKYRLSKLAAQQAGPAGGEFLAAFVFGSVSSLEKNTKNHLKTLGLLHVASASGANVGIVVALVQKAFSWLKVRQAKYLVLVIAIFCYADLAEFSASIVRASLGAVYRLGGEALFRRPTSPLVALGVSAITMVVISPGYLTNLSFQLSCLASLGLACFGNLSSVMQPVEKLSAAATAQPKLLLSKAVLPVWTDGRQPHVATQSQWGERLVPAFQTGYRRVAQTLSDSFWTSVAAQLFITPFLWWRFGD